MAQPEQGEAAGGGEKRGEHRVQPGHPLCQPNGLLTSSAGHQQEQAASQHPRRGLGERQQQHHHQQVSWATPSRGSVSERRLAPKCMSIVCLYYPQRSKQDILE